MNETLKTHGHCLLLHQRRVSHGDMHCRRASWAGFNLWTIRVGGQPVTLAKVTAMRRVGAKVFPGYGMAESGGIGLGCAQPADVDDVHLARDAFALIAFPHRIENLDLTVPAFNLTTPC